MSNLRENKLNEDSCSKELIFADYSEALEWTEKKSKQYKSMNEFYTSDEYKAAYPLIKKMHESEQSKFAKKAKIEPKKLGYVEWHKWAEKNTRQGHIQKQCPKCKKWFFKCEM